ncbi:MAG: hypothetical protein GF333_03415 [Candidatus Omnitrophica bacterium]|nr:hypothetical protein [Candidatus Omnitrophota bacterium]
MSVEKALDHFLGRNGCQRVNCAHALGKAFQDEAGLSPDVVQSFSRRGHGRAPEGDCGALYAGRVLIAHYDPPREEECVNVFVGEAGARRCRDIRSSRSLTCAQCVEAVARYCARIFSSP